MIPFINIMLVLLAIVITTASFISTGHLQVKLPETEATPSKALLTPIEIAINSEKRLYLNAEEIELKTLTERIAAIDKSQAFQLRIDSEVAFGTFVPVMEVLKKRGLEKLSIITRNRQ